MKLLILLIAMGVIGVIGTAEYSHAQTPLTINTNPAERTFNKIDLNTAYDDTIEIDKPNNNELGNGTLYNELNRNPQRANILIYYETYITGKTFTAHEDDYFCDKLVPETNDNNTDVPINHTLTLQVNYDKHTDPTECNEAPDIDYTGKLTLDKEIFITLINQNGKNIFYYVNGTENVTKIPVCTSTNFNTTAKTLKNNIEACYGKNGNDAVIVSKIIAIFGATTETLSEPDNTPANTPTPPDNTPANTNDENISEQEKAYRGLLKKLYLPAI